MYLKYTTAVIIIMSSLAFYTLICSMYMYRPCLFSNIICIKWITYICPVSLNFYTLKLVLLLYSYILTFSYMNNEKQHNLSQFSSHRLQIQLDWCPQTDDNRWYARGLYLTFYGFLSALTIGFLSYVLFILCMLVLIASKS